MKLDFICIGAQKAGTTTLHNILKQHPDIYLPKIKETHYFDKEELYQKGVDWCWQEYYKSNYNKEEFVGDITPDYLYFKKVSKRIYKDNGKDTKLIVILRNPVDRAYSHYLMSKRRGYENLSFQEAVKREPERLKQGEFEYNHFSYIDRGRYAIQLKRYFEFFDRKNILILIFEKEIKQNLTETIQKIEQFLGVQEMKLNIDIKSNPAREPVHKSLNQFLHGNNKFRHELSKLIPSQRFKYQVKQFLIELNMKKSNNGKTRLSEEEKRRLMQKYFIEDIKKLEQITTLNFSNWND